MGSSSYSTWDSLSLFLLRPLLAILFVFSSIFLGNHLRLFHQKFPSLSLSLMPSFIFLPFFLLLKSLCCLIDFQAGFWRGNLCLFAPRSCERSSFARSPQRRSPQLVATVPLFAIPILGNSIRLSFNMGFFCFSLISPGSPIWGSTNLGF